jgi:hypothetical protein
MFRGQFDSRYNTPSWSCGRGTKGSSGCIAAKHVEISIARIKAALERRKTKAYERVVYE